MRPSADDDRKIDNMNEILQVHSPDSRPVDAAGKDQIRQNAALDPERFIDLVQREWREGVGLDIARVADLSRRIDQFGRRCRTQPLFREDYFPYFSYLIAIRRF